MAVQNVLERHRAPWGFVSTVVATICFLELSNTVVRGLIDTDLAIQYTYLNTQGRPGV